MSLAEAEGVLIDAVTRPQRWRADKLAWRLHLTAADRAALGITTIGAIDATKADRKAACAQRKRQAQQARRRDNGATSRAVYLQAVKAAPKPWLAAGVSRATWYRNREM